MHESLKGLNSQRKNTNAEDSWQWGLTFTSQKMQHSYYLYYLIDNIMLDNPSISGIVEIGTGFGALTSFLGLWGIRKDISVLTVDHQDLHNKSIFKSLNITYLQMDEFSDELIKKVTYFIDGLNGPVLFICDGGNKIKEFNFWVSKLPPNSIIAVHDWTVEIDLSNINPDNKIYYNPYNQDNWNKMNVQFATFKINNPFLSIVTRNHLDRVESLSRCKESVNKLKDKDFSHVIIRDYDCLGIPHANKLLYKYRHLVTGKYVFILDDDDVLISGDLVDDIKEISEALNDPEIIFIRMILGDIPYPTSKVWEKDKLIPNHIGSSCFIMLNSLWQKNIEHFQTTKIPGDFNFINAAFLDSNTTFWQGKAYSKAEKLHRGNVR